MRAMADLGPGPHRSGEVARRLGVSVGQAGPLRNDLIKKGMIFSGQYGMTAFTADVRRVHASIDASMEATRASREKRQT